MRRSFLLPAICVATAAAASPAAAAGRAEIHGGLDRIAYSGTSSDGLLYGVGAGLDIPVGKKLVVGVEGNADYSNAKDCADLVIATIDEICLRARRDLSAAVRLGYEPSAGAMVYALAGYSSARFRLEATPAGGTPIREVQSFDGLRLGVGLQHAVRGGVYSKLEYRYSNYEAGAERHHLVAGLGVRF